MVVFRPFLRGGGGEGDQSMASVQFEGGSPGRADFDLLGCGYGDERPRYAYPECDRHWSFACKALQMANFTHFPRPDIVITGAMVLCTLGATCRKLREICWDDEKIGTRQLGWSARMRREIFPGFLQGQAEEAESDRRVLEAAKEALMAAMQGRTEEVMQK